MFIAITAMCTSGLVCYLVLASTKLHGRFTFDNQAGIQKIHGLTVPRVGGVGIFVSVVFVSLAFNHELELLQVLAIASVPAFLAGLLEDLTKRISPAVRLSATILSGILAYILTGYRISEIGIDLIDPLFSIVPCSVVFSAVAVAGISNSFNIIDGFNGLAGITAKIALLAIGLVAWRVQDFEIVNICLVFGAATVGFTLWNWPLGRLFLGDGGAYTIGFVVGWLALALVERNTTVSPFVAVLICIYPITEVLFSIYRRFARKHNPSSPDRLHMHSLIGRRWVDRRFSRRSKITRNSIAGITMSTLSLPSASVVLLAYDSMTVCISLCALFVTAYILGYRRLIRFHW